jgi:hypothetical protein
MQEAPRFDDVVGEATSTSASGSEPPSSRVDLTDRD